jgi:hypothetical protein
MKKAKELCLELKNQFSIERIIDQILYEISEEGEFSSYGFNIFTPLYNEMGNKLLNDVKLRNKFKLHGYSVKLYRPWYFLFLVKKVKVTCPCVKK